jgi:thiosulfate dehydrogenase (quinone) large subunit
MRFVTGASDLELNRFEECFSDEGRLRMENHREIGYALMRITYGAVFLFYGIGKFKMGVGNFVNGMLQQFAGKLPVFMVSSFAYVIPFVETISGILILIGLMTRWALVLSGLLLLGLTFGVVYLGQPQLVANNLIYVLLNFVLLWCVHLNRYSLDSFWERKAPAGFVTDKSKQ